MHSSACMGFRDARTYKTTAWLGSRARARRTLVAACLFRSMGELVLWRVWAQGLPVAVVERRAALWLEAASSALRQPGLACYAPHTRGTDGGGEKGHGGNEPSKDASTGPGPLFASIRLCPQRRVGGWRHRRSPERGSRVAITDDLGGLPPLETRMGWRAGKL